MNSQTAYLLLKHTQREIVLAWKEFLGSKVQYAKALKNSKIDEKTLFEVSDKTIKSIQAIASELQHYQNQITLTSKPKLNSAKTQQTTTPTINLTPTLHQIQTIFSLHLSSNITNTLTCPANLSQLLFAAKVHFNLINFLIKQQNIDSSETVRLGLMNFIEGSKKFVEQLNHVAAKSNDKREKEAVNRIRQQWKSIVLRIVGKYFQYVFNLVQQNDRSDRQHTCMEIVGQYLVLIAQLTTATVIVPPQTDTTTSTSFWPFKRSIKQNSVTNTTTLTPKLQKSSISISGQYSQCQSMQQTTQNVNNQNQSKLTSHRQPQTTQPLLTNNQHQIINYYKTSLMQAIFPLISNLPTLFKQLIHVHLTSSTTKNTLQLTILQFLYSHMSRQQLESQVSEELQLKQYDGLLQRCNLFFGVLEQELTNGENLWGDGNKERMLEFVVEVYEKVMIEHKAFLERQFERKVEMSTKMGAEGKKKQRKTTGSNFRRFSFAQSIQDTNKVTDNNNNTEYTTNTPDNTTPTPNAPLLSTSQPFSLQLYQTNFSVINILSLLYDPLNNPETKTPDPSINVNKLNTLLTLHQVYLNQLNLPQLKEWISKKNTAIRDNYLHNLKQLQQKLMKAHQSTYLTLTTEQPSTKPPPQRKPTPTTSQQQQQQYLLSYQTIILESLQQLTTQLKELIFVYHNTHFTSSLQASHFQYYEQVATGILSYVRQLMLLIYECNGNRRQNDASVIKNNVMTSIKMVKLLESLMREIWLEYSRIFSQNQQHQTYFIQYKQMLLSMMNSWMSTLQRFCKNQPEWPQPQYRNLKSLQIISVILSSDNKDNNTLQPTEQHQPSPTYLTPDTTPFIKHCLILCQHAYPYLSNQPHLKTKSRILSSVITPLFQLFSFHPNSQENLTLLIQVMSDNYYDMKEKLCEERYRLGEELMVIDMVLKYFEAWVRQWRGSGKRAISVQREEMLERLVIVLQLYHNQATGMNHFHKQLAVDAMDTLSKIDQSCKRTFKELVKWLQLGNQAVNLQQDDIIREGSDTISKQQSLRLVKIITQSPLYTMDCVSCITQTLPNNPHLPTVLNLFSKVCQLTSSSIINQQHLHDSQYDTNHHNHQQLTIQLSNTFSEMLDIFKEELKIEQLERLLQMKEMVVDGMGKSWGNFVVSWEVEVRLIQGYVRGKGEKVGRVQQLLDKVKAQVGQLVGLCYSSSNSNKYNSSDGYNSSSNTDSSNNNNNSNKNNRLYYLHCLTHPLPHLINIISLLLHNSNPNYQQHLHHIITTITSLFFTIITQHLTPTHNYTISNLTIPQTPSFKLHSQQLSGLQSIVNNRISVDVEVRDEEQMQYDDKQDQEEWAMESIDDEDVEEKQDGRQVIVSQLEIGEGCDNEREQRQQHLELYSNLQPQHQYHPQNPPLPHPTTQHTPLLTYPPSTPTLLHLTHFHSQLLTTLSSTPSNHQLLVATILQTLVKIYQTMIQSRSNNIMMWQEEKKQLMVEVVRLGVEVVQERVLLDRGDMQGQLGLQTDLGQRQDWSLTATNTSNTDNLLPAIDHIKQSILQLRQRYPFLQQQLPTPSSSQPQLSLTPPLPSQQQPHTQPTTQPNLTPLLTHLQQLASSNNRSQFLKLFHNIKHTIPQQLSTLSQSLLHPQQQPATPTILQTKSIIQQIHQLFLKLLTPTPTINPPQSQTIQCYHEIFSALYPILVDLLEFSQLSKAIKLILKQNLQLKSTSNLTTNLKTQATQ